MNMNSKSFETKKSKHLSTYIKKFGTEHLIPFSVEYEENKEHVSL